MNDFDKKCNIANNDTLGRYVTAAVDIKAGETILLDCPVLILSCAGDKRCMNCMKLANNFCRNCQVFPLCDNCSQHNKFDCDFFANLKDLNHTDLQKSNDIYGLLKFLLMHENEETKKYYEELLLLEAHLDERRSMDIWKEYNDKVVKPVMNSGLSKYLTTHALNEELIQKFYGLMDVNCFEIRGPDVGTMRAVYLKSSMLSHSCVANTVIAIDEQYQLKMYANRHIAQGDTLSYCYTNVLLGTDERAQILKMGKYFHCCCERCVDPTELGSHMSSLICPICMNNKREGGFVVKQQNSWQCMTCKHNLNAENVEKIIERAKEEIFHAKDDIYRYEMLLAKLSRYLHGNHYLMFDLKQNIVAILRAIIQNLAQRPGRKVYERKVHLCKEIMHVLGIIQPGISRIKAIALYELCNSYAELSRLRFGENEISEAELLELLKQAEAMLRECIRMLLYEPVETPEGKLARSMLKELKDLQNDQQLIQQHEGVEK